MLLGRPCSHSLKVAKRLRRRVATFIGMTSVEKKDINVAVVLRTSRYASVHTPFDGDVMMIPLLFLLSFASTMPSTNLNSTCKARRRPRFQAKMSRTLSRAVFTTRALPGTSSNKRGEAFPRTRKRFAPSRRA
jgi:hypothetical protein